MRKRRIRGCFDENVLVTKLSSSLLSFSSFPSFREKFVEGEIEWNFSQEGERERESEYK